ncbi:hypothetical protein BGW80DRAFT_1437699 [Lactifluus volemus]|nr:hypothetical protein BGW80DRAFT_1437699 [Lactifluus volemus]
MEGHSEELPEYSPNPVPTCSRSLDCEHWYGHDWFSFVVKSRAADSSGIPVFLAGDTITGEVRLNIGKTKTIKGLKVTISAGTRISVQQEEIFLHKTEPIWTPASSKETKVIGQRTYPFSIALPLDVNIQHDSNAAKTRFLLPPTFDEQNTPLYITYKLFVIARRGWLKFNTELSTRFVFFPDTVANPPSPLRTLAYAGGRIFPGPDADPEGWKVCEPVEITGKLFKARDVSVQCTLAIATPLMCASNSPIPLLLTLHGTDVLALDLFARAPNLQLLRTITIGSEATAVDSKKILPWNDYKFYTSITKAVFWPHEGGAGAEFGRHAIPRTDEQQAVRVLRGEIFVPTGLGQSFIFPDFTCRYSIVLLQPKVPGFVPASAPLEPFEDPLLTECVTITMSNAPGVTLSSQIPPSYEAPIIEGDYNIMSRLLLDNIHFSTTCRR